MSARLQSTSSFACALFIACATPDAVVQDAGRSDMGAIDARADAPRAPADADAHGSDAVAIEDTSSDALDAVAVEMADSGALGPLDGGGSASDASRSDAGFACPMAMAQIPAGMFLMGDPAADDPPSQPVHGVALSAFCLDVTEVTVAAYGACAAPGCTAPGSGRACNQGIAGRDNHPINCVDWNQARAYCRWRGGDLPTEAQWEYAARGTDGRTYPWGNDAPMSQLCWSGGGATLANTCPVGSFPSGASPFGALDLAGNVWEWTLDWYGAYVGSVGTNVTDPAGAASGISRVNRGGAWGNALEIDVRPMIRFGGRPTRRLESLGFRCARAAL